MLFLILLFLVGCCTSNECYNNILPVVPKNDNWRQIDQTSVLRLGYGKNTSDMIAGTATFRQHMDSLRESCQFWMPDNSLTWIDPGFGVYLTGVGQDLFKGSTACGQCLLITNPATNLSVISVIADYIPTAKNPGQLDLQSGASAFLASGNSTNPTLYHGGPRNHASLLIQPVECIWGDKPIQYYFDVGSSKFHWYVVVMFNAAPFDEVKLFDCQMNPIDVLINHDLYGRWVFQFRNIDGVANTYKIQFIRENGTKIVTDKFYYTGCQKCVVIGTSVDYPSSYNTVPGWPLP